VDVGVEKYAGREPKAGALEEHFANYSTEFIVSASRTKLAELKEKRLIA
jgi:hypothetical protein